MATARCKFQVTKVSEFGYGGIRQNILKPKNVPAGEVAPDGSVSTSNRTIHVNTGIPVREITLMAVYGASAEDRSFATSTPQGSMTFRLDNPALEHEFKPGQTYYIDFTPAE